VTAVEYLGTTQIVTIETAYGEIKARAPSRDVIRTDASVGLELDRRSLTLFDAKSGKALMSEGNEGVLIRG
jgi:multiple sugar transport system ATP-binding protein